MRFVTMVLALCAAGCSGGGGGGGGSGGVPPVTPVGGAAGGDGPWLTIEPAALPPATQGGAYSVTLTALGGTGSGYTWSAGALPPGLSLSGATLSGTPTTAGSLSAVIRVKDSGAAIGSRDYTIDVVPAGSPLAVATTLPAGTPGVSYSQPLTATGGTGPYSWSIASGALPPGLSLSGATVSGVPLAGGTFAGTLQATDSATNTATSPFSIPIPMSMVVFVDGSTASSATYDPATRSATGGTFASYNTLAGAAGVPAGTTVLVRAGTYAQALAPASSGTAMAPIVFRAYGSEAPIITGAFDPAINLTGRSYIMIDGLTVQDVTGWLRGTDVYNCEIRRCTFLRATATGTRGAIALGKSRWNRIVRNRIEDGNDNLGLYLSDDNLIEGNAIRQGRHTLWRIVGGSRNIVRNNYFRNTTQKIGECFDFEGGVSWLPEPEVYDVTKDNVIEASVFDTTGSSGNASPFAGIQYAAQRGIIRHNVFYDCVGPGLSLTLYANEARYNTDNRIYGNVFTRIGNGGIDISGSTSYTFGGQRLKNNVLYKCIYDQTDFRWTWYAELDGKPVQVLTGRQSGFLFERNVIFGNAVGDTYTITYGSRTSTSNPPQSNLAWWEANWPALFFDNREFDPMFANAAGNDFTLSAGSPAIDAGAFLTTTASAGSGTSMPVADATWFTGGNGLVAGDEIQLDGQTATARVTAVNPATNVLTLEAPLSWTAGAGVARKYRGARPDIGAFERP